MQRTLIFGLLLAILLVTFALQNSETVPLKLWFWDIRPSLALLIICSFSFGAIVGLLFSLPVRRKKKTSEEKQENNEKDNEDKF